MALLLNFSLFFTLEQILKWVSSLSGAKLRPQLEHGDTLIFGISLTLDLEGSDCIVTLRPGSEGFPVLMEVFGVVVDFGVAIGDFGTVVDFGVCETFRIFGGCGSFKSMMGVVGFAVLFSFRINTLFGATIATTEIRPTISSSPFTIFPFSIWYC